MIAVTIILLTGIYGSLAYVPTFQSLLHTNYGQVLIGKILLFLIMLALGSFHYIKGRKRGNKDIRNTVGFELGVGLLVHHFSGYSHQFTNGHIITSLSFQSNEGT